MTFPECRQSLRIDGKRYTIYNISELESAKHANISRLPFSIRILLENILRHCDAGKATEQDITNVARWGMDNGEAAVMIPYHPSRVLMQDFTGVPAVVDLAAMRDAVNDAGGDPDRINPLVPVDLVVDHSVQVDYQGTKDAALKNVQKEYERNVERYTLLKWAQKSFDNFRVVPPGSGICHQVNLEHLAHVINARRSDGEDFLYPDTLVGTDSHTTMINGLGVVGWGVGGIEAEAVMLGQPYFMTLPDVVGVYLTGRPAPGVTATDIVLHITQVLRQENVVEKFVEFTGPGMKSLSLTDRATISNMSPEYGATIGFFPVDENTLEYLSLTGRKSLVNRVETYCRNCSLFSSGDEPIEFTRKVNVDLSTILPSVAGPYRPQDRISVVDVKASFETEFNTGENQEVTLANTEDATVTDTLCNGSVVIAAITSCTNTSNPSVMLGAALAAKKAVEKGLEVPFYVKTSLSPGSKVVADYLDESGLMPYLESLGFHVAGFGCMTCIGNSGPLYPGVEAAIKDKDLKVAAVLSGNRNFEARVHQSTKANYLMSPILVVMYALAGRVNIDFDTEPLGHGTDGNPVFMKDIWPQAPEIEALVDKYVRQTFFENQYAAIFDGDKLWRELDVPESRTFKWAPDSLYIRRPPFFEGFAPTPGAPEDIESARTLLLLGDSITTDHISPAGAIPADYPAGKYLTSNGVAPENFNSYGSRRGNHEVMMRGTFGNIRIKNRLVEESGSFTLKLPEEQVTTVYDAAMAYKNAAIPLIILGGKEYGTGSSRDWAAKGTTLLGIKAVLAESFERIHRSNLVGMGVLPLVFSPGDTWQSLGLTGHEIYSISGITQMTPGCELNVIATTPDNSKICFKAISRLDNDVDIAYFKNEGILSYVLRQIING